MKLGVGSMRKIVMILSLIIAFGILSSADAKEKLITDKGRILLPQQIGNSYGYVDKSDLVVIVPQFEEAGNFCDDLARVKKESQYGYINKAGQFVIEPQFDEAGDFDNGKAKVIKNGDELYIGDNGKIIGFAGETKRKKLAEEAAQKELDKKEKFHNSFLSKKKPPKEIYLQAGRYERQGEQRNAKSLYEFLADNFPDSPYSEKANDRLLSLKSTRDISDPHQENTSDDECIVGSDIIIRERFNTTTSSGNPIADVLFGAMSKEKFLVEYHGIIKSKMGNKVELYYQDYNLVQEKGGGIFEQRTDKKYLVKEYADKKIGRSLYHEKSICTEK